MDPLECILPELHDLILQHCRGNDFKETTEVSPSWNEILGKSHVMMKKVKLEWVEFWESEKILTKNDRRYSNVFLNLVWINKSRKQYLATLTPTEMEIDFFGEPRVGNGEALYDIDVSRLRVLKLRLVSEQAVNNLLSRCDHLTRLELKTFTVDDISIMSIPIVKSFLERNQHLEDLELGIPFSNIFFEEDFSAIVKFKLKRLSISLSWSRPTVPNNVKLNFLKFLKHQSQSLQELYMGHYDSTAIEHAVNKMPALVLLSVAYFSQLLLGDVQLNLNERIVDLSIGAFSSPGDLVCVTSAMPNVTKLTTEQLTEETLKFVASNLPQLRTLRYSTSDIAVDDPVWTSIWPNSPPIYEEHNFYSFI